jgi:hypothetical protein
MKFVCEALRQYVGRRPCAAHGRAFRGDPTTDEIAAVAEGQKAPQKGEFISLEEFRHGLDRRSKQSSRKKS